jgi:serine protease Do
VSGINRSIPAPTGFSIPDAIQTDAAVNPGNSGGPLMSLDGRIVAVINSGGGENTAFGISAALTQRVVPERIQTGDYDHAYMGVSFTDVTPEVAQANDTDDPRGLVVVDVVDGGPAEGVLQPSETIRIVDGERVPAGGDVILAIGGSEIMRSEDLASHLARQTRPGETVELTVLRDGTEQTVELGLGARPE